MRIWPGTPYPLGATWDGWGTNFTLFSEVAERVELCLFDEAGDSGTLRETRVELTEVDGFVWHGYLPGIAPGLFADRIRHAALAAGAAAVSPALGACAEVADVMLDRFAQAGTTRRTAA